jgi:hypothetical protein
MGMNDPSYGENIPDAELPGTKPLFITNDAFIKIVNLHFVSRFFHFTTNVERNVNRAAVS